MPIHLPSLNRRGFLQVSASAAVSTFLVSRAGGQKKLPADPHRFAFVSDTHIMEDPSAMARGINMANHLRRAVEEIVEEESQPAGVIINGDLVTDGSPPTTGAYRMLARLIDPLRRRGIPLHLTMGNCDRRGLFVKALEEFRPAVPPVDGRLVGVLKAERANFFFLDSLHDVERTITKGSLGQAQLKWLAQALDENRDKPAIVVAHHHVNRPKGRGRTWREGGLIDGQQFVEVLGARGHVKAFLFGHTHNLDHETLDGIHLVSLPTTAYIFDPAEPYGWLDGQLEEDGMVMRLRSLDRKHPRQGEELKLRWR